MVKPNSLAYLSATFLLLTVSTLVSAHSSLHHTFLQCLTHHTKNCSTQLSDIVFANTNPKFPTVLQNYIRNARFNTSSTPKPLLIVTPLTESHVQAAVICAKPSTFNSKSEAEAMTTRVSRTSQRNILLSSSTCLTFAKSR